MRVVSHFLPSRFRTLGAAFAAIAVCAVGLSGPSAAFAADSVARTGHVTADLVPQTVAGAPGRTLEVALHQVIAPGWHTYWRNPGDAGQPTTLGWTLPPGWRAGPIAWPAPERFLAGSIMNYVYTGEVYLPVALQVPAGARPGQTAHLTAAAAWLVCKDICIPEQATLALDVPIAAATPATNPHGGAAIARSLAGLPKAAGLTARYAVDAGSVKLSVAGAALKGLTPAGAYFYPYDGTVLEQASPQTAVRGPHGVILTLPAGYRFTHGGAAAALDGVLSIDGKAFELSAAPDGAQAAAAAPPATASVSPPSSSAPSNDARPTASGVAAPSQAAPPVQRSETLGLAAALGLAFVGGLILNLMPCVFPVLSMKAAALARHIDSPARARADGLAFLGGVVASFLVLAALLIAARAAGQAVGWGYQLQSPAVVGVLVLVLFAAGLNLSGVFEAGLSLQGVGAETAGRTGGLAGAALTGVLAVVVAAPCTAPFMAPAMGWALTQPPVEALSVFLALALGLAAPFVAIAFSPALFRRLPRPGPWMEGLRKLLAFPMYAAAAWFAWVFVLQAGDPALLRLLAAALGVAFAAFCWGVAQRTPRPTPPRLAALAAALGATAALWGVGAASATGAPVASAASPAGLSGPGAPQPWSAERVVQLRASGHPVFVDFTAAWCVTCQVNERTALAGGDVARAFARTGAVYLKADWTRPDPAITAALAAQGRSGVPLYLVYGPRRPQAEVLPQLLTGGDVVRALEAAARA